MMKKIFILTTAVFLLMLLPFQAHSGIHQAKDGFKEIITAPFAIPRITAEQVSDNESKTLGFVAGILEGSAQATKKLFTGVISIVTFPFTDGC